ncbi:MAG: acetyl-CoA carboxylase carboxyltransferase subunit beta [Oscillospiraceae bacterium]|nr:acetyl-CoA carboxylase carboxyltransferase subunit beta [Oscillospiraceae bacterium]
MLDDFFNSIKSRIDYDNKSKPIKGKKNRKMAIPPDLLFKCPRCQELTFMDEFEKNQKVCLECNYHSRLSSKERINMIIDEGTFVEYDEYLSSKNPLNFPDYDKKIEQAKLISGENDAVKTGEGKIFSKLSVIIIMESNFMMGSMGSVVGEKISRAFENAIEKKLSVVLFSASGGARMQEGIISLMQMAKTAASVSKHNDAGLLYISVMTDPTTGGVTASFASLGDIIIAEPKILIGFAGRRVIEGTIKQKLPDDFQTAEFMLEHGFVDMIVDRVNMKNTIYNILDLHDFSKETDGGKLNNE